MVSMPEYKRNQVEEAISGVLEPNSPEPTSELRTRLKRLLETDRALGRASRSSDPERANYAFYSAEAPGSGVEVWFSDYEAFALLNGLRLMAHGWPQGLAVSILRRLRLRSRKPTCSYPQTGYKIALRPKRDLAERSSGRHGVR